MGGILVSRRLQCRVLILTFDSRVNRKQIQKPEVIVEALATVVGGEEAKSMVEKAGTPEVKKLLTEKTDEAFASGAFGLPWFVGECSIDCGSRHS